MPEVLGKSSNVAEILWNFNRCKGEKRITLKQNPHFYNGLPRKKEAYGDDFRNDPMESFLDTPEVYVLTDRPSRVYLQSGQDARAFGNVWLPNDAIIFKGTWLLLQTWPLSTSLQTSAASSKAKASWEHPFKATLKYGTVLSLCSPPHRQMPFPGSHYRTGENRFAAR